MPDHTNQGLRRGRLRSIYVKWLPAALLTAALANIVLTLFLPPTARPIVVYEDGSLTDLIHAAQPSVNRRFGFYLELDDATGSGTLFVPTEVALTEELVDGFSGLDVVVSVFDPSLPPDLEVPPPLGVLETEDGDFSYSLIEGSDDVWWLAVTDDSIVVIPNMVAPVPEPRS